MIGSRIREVRKELKLSQEEFGLRVGLTRSAVGNIETGRFRTTNSILNNIAKEFNINEEWLHSGDGDKYIHRDTDQELMDDLMKIFLNSNDNIKELISIIPRLENKDIVALKQIAMSLQKK